MGSRPVSVALTSRSRETHSSTIEKSPQGLLALLKTFVHHDGRRYDVFDGHVDGSICKPSLGPQAPHSIKMHDVLWGSSQHVNSHKVSIICDALMCGKAKASYFVIYKDFERH